MLTSARSEQKTLTEIAEQELRQTINRGTFRRRSQLPTQAALCQMLGDSRTVIRQALRKMSESAGLTSGTRHLAVQSGTADDEPLICSGEYHLRNAFDLIVWRRDPIRLQGVLAESTP